jgi:hypothetical protein
MTTTPNTTHLVDNYVGGRWTSSSSNRPDTGPGLRSRPRVAIPHRLSLTWPLVSLAGSTCCLKGIVTRGVTVSFMRVR